MLLPNTNNSEFYVPQMRLQFETEKLKFVIESLYIGLLNIKFLC